MRKWIGLFLSLFLMGVWGMDLAVSGTSNPVADAEGTAKPMIVFAQGLEKNAKGDTYSVTLLRQIREKVETWLKSLNEKIENEEITRFEVRFYEILRNILEWVKEKIDAKIGSSEGEVSPGKERGGRSERPFRRGSHHSK